MPTPAAVLVLLLLPRPVAAAEPLSLQTALREALENHPDLVSAGFDVAAAKADVLGARGSTDPTLSASSGLQYAQSSSYLAGSALSATSQTWGNSASLSGALRTGTTWSLSASLDHDRSTTLSALSGTGGEQLRNSWAADMGIQLRQDLLAPVRTSDASKAITGSLDQLDLAELTRRQAQEQVLGDTADTWWAWWKANEAVQAAIDAEAAARSVAEVTAAWADEGESTRLELAKAQVSLLEARSNLLQAEAQARAAADTLLLALGRAPGETLDIDPRRSLALLSVAPSEDDVLAGNIDLALARRKVQVLQRQRAWAGDALLPDVDLVVGAGVASLEDSPRAATTALIGDGALPQASAGVELSLPLGNRGARGARDRASLELDQARAAEAATEREVRANLRADVDALQTAWQAVALAEDRVELAREAEDLERARLDAGTRRIDQVLDALDDRRAAEADLLSAQGDLAHAGLDLVKLRGGLVALATGSSPQGAADVR